MKTIENPIKEIELQEICGNFFRQKQFLIKEEVPFLLKVIDLFGFRKETGECIAIEVKIRNWRRALTQALVYQLMAERVYIALLDRYIRPVDHEMLIGKGIGLLSIALDGKVEVILESNISERRLPYFTSQTLATAFPGQGSMACILT